MTQKRILERWQFEKLSDSEKVAYNARVYPRSISSSYWVQKIPDVPSALAGRPFHVYSLGRRPVSSPVFCAETVPHEPSPLRGRPFTIHSVGKGR